MRSEEAEKLVARFNAVARIPNETFTDAELEELMIRWFSPLNSQEGMRLSRELDRRARAADAALQTSRFRITTAWTIIGALAAIAAAVLTA